MVINQLKELGIHHLRCDEPMAHHTTWKIGGPADLYIPVNSRAQLVEVLRILHAAKLHWKVIGRGSNTLVSDKGIRGAVIKLEQGFDELCFDDTNVNVGAAYSFIKLSVMAGKKGLTGLEFAGGIPGSVGGAVYMNAGAHGSDISHILTSVDVLLPSGEIETWSQSELEFSYRHSIFQETSAVILSAQFALQHGERKGIATSMANYKERRQRTQPWNQACAGSVFRNPPGDFAARLIEQAGLKGTCIGGAQISEIHANFIVNLGHAKASDVLDLIHYVRTKIFELHGIELQPEVLILGEF